MNKSRFRAKELILPASLMAVGTFGVYNGWCRRIGNSVKEGMDNLRGSHYFRADEGILSARIGNWMLPLYQKWFHWQSTNTASSLVASPGYDPLSQSATLNLVCTF